MSTVNIDVSLALDTDGFLRRECDHCKREFKVIAVSHGGAPAPASCPDRYFCPYCGVAGDARTFWTTTQLEHMQARATEEVVGPALHQLEEQLDRLNRVGGGLFKVTSRTSGPAFEPSRRLVEPNDMVKVEFGCHSEPVKVESSWTGEVACPVCGARETTRRPLVT